MTYALLLLAHLVGRGRSAQRHPAQCVVVNLARSLLTLLAAAGAR